MDYKEKYNKLVEAVKVLQETNLSDEGIQNWVNDNVPELAVSEDERIMKEITELIMQPTWKTEKEFHRRKELLAWLEAQGEQKQEFTIGTINVNEQSICVKDPALRKIENQGGQKTIVVEDSDDEKTRKFLIKCVNENMFAKSFMDDDIDKSKVLDWLEKQGEQKSADKVEPKFKAGDKIISTISNIPYYITEVYNGYYLTDVGCVIMFNAQDNFELSNQKPAWSEEDEARLEACIKVLQTLDGYDTINVKWLKSLKDRIQPKQEWSEEEEQTFIKSVEALEDFCKFELADWLKEHKNQFLKPQNRWKPSDEQMEALKGVQEGAFRLDILGSLYQDLKKL